MLVSPSVNPGLGSFLNEEKYKGAGQCSIERGQDSCRGSDNLPQQSEPGRRKCSHSLGHYNSLNERKFSVLTWSLLNKG